MFDHLIEENNLIDDFRAYGLKENDILFIKEMITLTTELQEEEWCLKGRPSIKSFLYEVLNTFSNE